MGGALADALLIAVLLASAATDLRTGKIYNRVTYPALALAAVMSLAGHGPPLSSAVAGMLAGGGLLYVVFALGWMGGGDVKLMAFAGAMTGYPLVLHALFYAIFLGGVLAALVLIWRGELVAALSDMAGLVGPGPRAGGTRGRLQPRGGALPFGAAIAGGTLLAVALARFG
jgi:prepilin peptidase CpaA